MIELRLVYAYISRVNIYLYNQQCSCKKWLQDSYINDALHLSDDFWYVGLATTNDQPYSFTENNKSKIHSCSPKSG